MGFHQLVAKLSKWRKNKMFVDLDINKLRLRLLDQYLLELPLPDQDETIDCIVDNMGFHLSSREDWRHLMKDIERKPILSENLLHSAIMQGDVDEDNTIHSIVDNMWINHLSFRHDWRHLIKDLQRKLKFTQNLLRFATMQGVKQMQLIDLLAHCTFLAVHAECLRDFRLYVGFGLCNDVEFEISQVQQKIRLVDPQFCVTSIRVLKASKVVSRSSVTLTLGKNKHIVEGFLDSLQTGLGLLLECFVTFTAPMLKLYEGVRFLTILLSLKHEKFYELSDKMKDRIGVMIIDVGILIFSISMDEMKDGLAKETDFVLFHLLEELQFVMEEVAHIYPPSSLQLSFHRTNELGFIGFLLENLKEVKAGSSTFPMAEIKTVQEDLVVIRSFLEKIVDQRNENEKLQAFWSHVMEVAYKAEFAIESTVLGDEHEHCLGSVAREINLIRIEALEIYDNIRHDGATPRVTKNLIQMPSHVTAPISSEDFLGLKDEVETIINRLTGGSMLLDIVPVVGMAGLGKTTLANTVYCDPSVIIHFPIRVWCTVSQAYIKRNLIAQILSCIASGSSNEYLKMTEDDLAEKLYKCLKRNRYLIVLDDMWDIGVWNLLKTSLPDDANQSRILFTSRLQNLSMQIKPDSKPHHLRSLTDKESWELLQIKLFGNVGCPPSLCEFGIQIANNCKGLPLSVVLVAGILATTTQDCAMWEEVAKSLSSSIVLEAEQCMKTLEKSYIHLPDHLKPCLLYFSAFPEDKDIPVRSLLWLWISEGFVQKTEGKSLEDVAHQYLMDLIARSLVMATEQRARGGAKACRVHDLVHEFCVAKAKEESFLHTSQHGDIFTYTGPCNPYRLCIYSPTGSDQKSVELEQSRLYFPYLRSLLVFANGAWTFDVLHFCTGFWMFKLLRVLDLGEPFFIATCFPKEVTRLVHLRYLAIHGHINYIPSAIGNLSRLETFLVRGCIDDVLLPNTIWNIKTLRHLYITRSEKGFSFPIDSKLEDRLDLKNLATLALAIDPSSQCLQKILTKLPSIRKIRCTPLGSRKSTGNHNGILVLDYLSQLESLNVRGFVGYEFEFPLNLKKLTLSSNRQPWSEISVIGKLPNLEVLKLESSSFVGEKWEMKEGEFCRLRFLKLLLLDIRIWTASSDNFSCLEKLVLHICPHLEEVPSCLGEIPTLEMIEVKFCPESALSYVKQIQMEMGNEGLKIVTERCW